MSTELSIPQHLGPVIDESTGLLKASTRFLADHGIDPKGKPSEMPEALRKKRLATLVLYHRLEDDYHTTCRQAAAAAITRDDVDVTIKMVPRKDGKFAADVRLRTKPKRRMEQTARSVRDENAALKARLAAVEAELAARKGGGA